MQKKILIGGVIFTLLLALILSYNSYQRFVSIILRNHENDALRTAQTALTFVDKNNFSDYNQNFQKQNEILNFWQKIVDTQDAIFIYVIEPFDDYKNIRFGINVKETDSNYFVRPIGYVMQTGSDEYKNAYKNIYEGKKDFEFVIRDNGISLSGDHVTAMIPIKNSKNVVQGILCVQWQMNELDDEKIIFLKNTIAATIIYLILMLFIGNYYLNSKLLNPLKFLTDGVKEISAGNLDKKIKIETGDEIQTLAENFNIMTDKLKIQMSNLEKITAEKERIATELDVATKIQKSMLPKNFSIDERIEIFATMTPAKEVGGDLYDFYKIDENNLFVTIADVSGKGVIIGQISNVILSFLLVSNGFGIKGAGIALITSDIITISFALKKYFSSKERTRNFCKIFDDIGKFFKQVFELLKSGVPTACSTGLISIKVWAIYQILGHAGGSGAMTLYAVCMACLSVISMCIAGCNGAMMPIVGMLFGEKDFVGVRMLVKYVLRFAISLSGIFVIFVWICPQIILSIYNVPENLFADGSIALRLFSLSLIGVTLTFLVMYYYSTIQRRFAANILSWTEGILVVVPAAWIFSKNFGLNGIWFAFILAEISGFLMIWIYSKYICKNSGGKLNDIFLIEKTEPNLIYDVSLKADEENAVKIYSEAIEILKNEKFSENVALKVGVALEEMMVNISKINEKIVDVDVRIKSEGEKIFMAICDNGKSFNPTEYQSHENFNFDNIEMLKAISKNIQYSRNLSLNQTVIEI